MKRTEGQKYMGAVTLGGERGWLFDIYRDFQALPDAADRTTFQVFSAYRGQSSRFGLQYSYQDREDDPRVEFASVFGVLDLLPDVSIIGLVAHDVCRS